VKGSSALRCPMRVIPIRSVLCQGQEPEPRPALTENGSFGAVEFSRAPLPGQRQTTSRGGPAVAAAPKATGSGS
jgi:hypothetical protein